MENAKICSSKFLFSIHSSHFCSFFQRNFQGVNQVDSFRTEAERRKAFSANTFDSIPRQGTYHSGIYNVPRTTVKT